MNTKTYPRLTDEKVGHVFWFEYHCLESHTSGDAQAWYRSHQQVTVLSISTPGGGDTSLQRGENGEPRVYRCQFADGLQWDIFEDELLNSPAEFYRPDPPSSNPFIALVGG